MAHDRPARSRGAGSRAPSRDEATNARSRVAAVLLLLVAAWLLRRRRRGWRRPQEHEAFDQPESLRYRVPVGQDPAAVVAALRQAGYYVTRDEAPTRIHDLLITDATGSLDREAVRTAIERAPIDLEGAPAPQHRVVFVDEPGQGPQAVM